MGPIKPPGPVAILLVRQIKNTKANYSRPGGPSGPIAIILALDNYKKKKENVRPSGPCVHIGLLLSHNPISPRGPAAVLSVRQIKKYTKPICLRPTGPAGPIAFTKQLVCK